MRPEIAFYEEVRVWMAKFDADDRQANGEPIPEEIARLLGDLIADTTAPARSSTSTTPPGCRSRS